VSCSSQGYCRNEGQCEANEGRKKAVCSCSGGFWGKRCHKKQGRRIQLNRYDRKYKERRSLVAEEIIT
jgi:hypothetical protein